MWRSRKHSEGEKMSGCWRWEVGDGVVNGTCFGREGRGVHIGGCEIPMVAHDRACRVPPMHVG